MGVDTLIRRLQENKNEQIKLLWQEAEKEAAAIRRKTTEAIDSYTEKKEKELSVDAGNAELPILQQATRRSYQTILDGQEKLLQRTYELARQSLGMLRDDSYPRRFRRLFKEVPPLAWETIIVCGEDAGLARKLFPDVEIREDNTVSGGFMATMENGDICVDNTLEKRLEKIWPQFYPLIIKEIYEQLQSQPEPGPEENG